MQASIVYADFLNCSEHFYQRTIPSYINAKVRQQITNEAYPLCFNGFAVMYSGKSRTPLWSAEYLTKERIYQADEMLREDNFHEERRVATNHRGTLKAYSGSGYDRGHLAPNSDMANLQQQYDSFSLANIVPQSPYLNRNTWKQIESATRYLTKVYDETYVITGAVFNENSSKVNGTVSVPTHLFKALYFPKVQQAGVYYAPNDESGRIEVLSLQEFTDKFGVVLMPSLDASITTKRANLPMPFEAFGKLSNELKDNEVSKYNNSREVENVNSELSLSWIFDWLIELVTWFVEQLKQ